MYKVEIFSTKKLHLTIWLCLTLKYNACSVKPDINIKQRNPPKRVILYKYPDNDKSTSISQNKSKFFLLRLQNLRGNVTNFFMLSCFRENQSNLMYTTNITHSDVKQYRA